MSVNIYLLTFLQAGQKAASPEMTPAGWLFMGVAWAAIIIVTVWTFGKILGKK